MSQESWVQRPAMRGEGAGWWAENSYDDIGWCVELGATYDDTLKKDETFTAFAVEVGQRIAATFDPKLKVTWGKWGARLEPKENTHLPAGDLILLGRMIVRHASWAGLCLATWVFTYGPELEDDRLHGEQPREGGEG